MELKEIMTTEVNRVAPTATVVEAARLMREKNIGMLPVLAGEDLVGVITDRDIIVKCIAAGRSAEAATVQEVMSKSVYACFEDQTVDEAEALMGRRQVRRLPVLDRSNRLVGIVALGDIATESPASAPVGETLAEVSRD